MVKIRQCGDGDRGERHGRERSIDHRDALWGACGALQVGAAHSFKELRLLSFESVLNRDYPVVFANLYIFSLLGLAVNLISDLTYAWTAPRIDVETRAV